MTWQSKGVANSIDLLETTHWTINDQLYGPPLPPILAGTFPPALGKVAEPHLDGCEAYRDARKKRPRDDEGSSEVTECGIITNATPKQV